MTAKVCGSIRADQCRGAHYRPRLAHRGERSWYEKGPRPLPWTRLRLRPSTLAGANLGATKIPSTHRKSIDRKPGKHSKNSHPASLRSDCRPWRGMSGPVWRGLGGQFAVDWVATFRGIRSDVRSLSSTRSCAAFIHCASCAIRSWNGTCIVRRTALSLTTSYARQSRRSVESRS
jgi:hypothetical protein